MSVRFLWNKESSLIITAPAPYFTEPNDNIVNSPWELTLRGYRVCTGCVQVYRVSERGSGPVVPGWPRSLALSGLARWRRPDSPGQSVSWLRGSETQCCQCSVVSLISDKHPGAELEWGELATSGLSWHRCHQSGLRAEREREHQCLSAVASVKVTQKKYFLLWSSWLLLKHLRANRI